MDIKTAFPVLLPKAIDWAVREEEQVMISGRILTARESAWARQVGVKYPERIRVALVQTLPLPKDPDLRAAALQTGILGSRMVGLTLGYSVFVCNGHETPRLLTHEFRHVYQYEQAGSIAAFLPGYLLQIVQFGYDNAPFEKDATAYENISNLT